MSEYDLSTLGWDQTWQKQAIKADSHNQGWIPGRVVLPFNRFFRVKTARGDWLCESAGKLKHLAIDRLMLPLVGDWVMVSPQGQNTGRIEAILPRRTCLIRKEAGDRVTPQALAANVDHVAILTACDQDMPFNRIERFLEMAFQSGAQPMLVLNKADLVAPEALQSWIAQSRHRFPELPIWAVSAKTGEGVSEFLEVVKPGQTVVLMGPSGVGKSSVINTIFGHDKQKVGFVRDKDKKGRHTTIHHEVLLLPSGGVVIDSPGIRELQVWGETAGEAFKEIETLALSCKFRNCTHDREPDCAVQRAIQVEKLSPERVENYRKLLSEAKKQKQDRKESMRYRDKK